jgi:enoyl-CoA hydratase
MMETLQLERVGPVARLWLARPEHLNTMNLTMFDELSQVLDALAGDTGVRALLLVARGRAFCAGFDVAWMASLEPQTVAREIGRARAVYDALEAFPKPVIAAVQGAAVGGGLLLLLVADLILAAPEARFGAPEVKLGFFPPLDLIPRLERRVGLGAAKSLVLTGELIDAAEAHRVGLANRIVPAEELQREAHALAEQIAALPAAGVQSAKGAFAAARHVGYREWETGQLIDLWDSVERRQRMQDYGRRGA